MAGQRRRSGVDVDSADFERGLRDAVGRMRLRAESDLLRFGLDVQNRAREMCPVDTGRLRASIMSVPGTDRDGKYVEIGTNVEYGPYVEFGTSRAAAQPFLRPALLEAATSHRWTGT